MAGNESGGQGKALSPESEEIIVIDDNDKDIPLSQVVDMHPDPAMIHNNFEHYLLINNAFRSMKVQLNDKILVPQPSKTHTTNMEKKVFEKTHAVFYDRVSSCPKFDYFFYVTKAGLVHRLVFNRKESCVVEYNAVANPYSFDFNPVELPSNIPRLPINLHFAGERHVFLSTGTGWLIVYNTDDRKTNNRWSSIAYLYLPIGGDSFILHQDTNGIQSLDFGQPFYIEEVQMSPPKTFNFVLSTIIKKLPEELTKPDDLAYRTTIHWIEILLGDTHIARFNHHRILDVDGSVKAVTIDLEHKGLIVAADNIPVMVYNSPSPFKDRGIRKVVNQVAVEPFYTWEDTETTVMVTFNRPGVICKEDIVFQLSEKSIQITHRWERWLCGQLFGEIVIDECEYSFNRSLEKPPHTIIHVRLKKKSPLKWTSLVSTNKMGLNAVVITDPKPTTEVQRNSSDLYISWVESEMVGYTAILPKVTFFETSEVCPNGAKKFLISNNDHCFVYNFTTNPFFKHEMTFEKLLAFNPDVLNRKYAVYNINDRSLHVIYKEKTAHVFHRRIPPTANYQFQQLNMPNSQNVGVKRTLDYGALDPTTSEIIAAITTERLLYLFGVDCFYVIAY